ncbi:unnamed protein product [Didymodactylos carnosus]|uniref:Uncharacterized protein n=1 Tax=Didymodactylos carnosus TaxID=1234261 RepID=A0A8S2I7N2_9BILA|nr:unnamed protein product [Didymodactylos carnosus]CAF3721027.1 unnamed protein product [Didymodactylos carnosus]
MRCYSLVRKASKGVDPTEISLMNTLTTKLHFLVLSLKKGRVHFFIISTAYDETYIRTDDIVELLKEHGNTISLVLLSGIQYYTGQLFEIETITHVAHKQIFDKVSLDQLRLKSKLLTQYLQYLIETELSLEEFQILTPTDPDQRGAQL